MRGNTRNLASGRRAIEPQVKSAARRHLPAALAELLAVSITIGVATMLVLLFGMLTATL